MAKEYNPDIEPVQEWLGQFSPYFIYTAVVYVLNMWRENTRVINKSEKK